MPEPPEKLSAFIAKILDQLALSAWLPAALLATSLAVLYRLRVQKNLDIPSAVADLVKDPVLVLIVTIPVVVLTTLITQSFSFEAIRALEGYWQRRWLLGWLHRVLLSFRLSRKKSFQTRVPSALDRAFMQARGSMLRARIPEAVIRAIEDDLYERPRHELEEREDRLRAALNWREYGDPTQVAKYDRLVSILREYPPDGLLMPTQLGNVLRSTEAKLRNTKGDVSSFGIRRRQLVDPRVQLQHDQFRTRLDMYCTLVFVATFLGVSSPLILLTLPRDSYVEVAIWLVPSMFFLVLAFTSYRAAVASARGYCSILRIMDET